VQNFNGLAGVTFSAASGSTSVPFEFSPTLGLLLVGGLFGGNHLRRQHRASKLVFSSEE
jgi:hypothetical protein